MTKAEFLKQFVEQTKDLPDDTPMVVFKQDPNTGLGYYEDLDWVDVVQPDLNHRKGKDRDVVSVVVG